VRENLRVLLVSGEPHAGERTWRNMLKSDAAVDLVHFTILRPPDKQDGTPIRELSLIAFPIRELFEIKLNEFDLIIFDRYRRQGILPRAYIANLADYVEKGGALLDATGAPFTGSLSLYRTPLADIFPGRPTGTVRHEPFQPQLSAQGRRHPVTAGLPGAGQAGELPRWSRWFRTVNVDVKRGHVVMETPLGEPLLLLDRVEKGRVAQLYSDHVWLWSRGFEGGGPQAELLRRLAHWMMKEPDLEEEALRAEARDGRVEIERRSMTPREAPLTVTRPDGAQRQAILQERGDGVAVGALAADLPGIWRISDGEREALATVGAVNPREFADVRATPAKLQPIVAASQGGSKWLRDGLPDIRRVKPGRDAAGRGWIGLRSNEDYVVAGVDQAPLLPAIIILLLGLGATMLAWRREGR